MKINYKIAISTILTLTLIASFTGCSSKNNDTKTDATAVTEATTTDITDTADANKKAEPKLGGAPR